MRSDMVYMIFDFIAKSYYKNSPMSGIQPIDLETVK
jgi:hypothetical protein